jgi:L-fucose isomerase
MSEPRKLSSPAAPAAPFVLGVCATSDPRIDKAARQRCQNIVQMVAGAVAGAVKAPDGREAQVVWTPVLIDGEKQADLVARQFKSAGVGAVILAPDTWAFPQLTLMSLLAQMDGKVPVNITCGNSGPKPGVVFAHAVNGALAQSGRLVALNVGSWPDTGQEPRMSRGTEAALVDWCHAAMTAAGLRGRRVVVFGHDSMGMETALAHVLPTRKTFGLEITRLDMKLLADMLAKGAYDAKELRELRAWLDKHLGRRIAISNQQESARFDQGLALYLVVRDLLADLNAVGGGFMSQLEWGSDPRGTPLAVADAMESLLNSTFDHRGPKPPMPFATEADVQGLLTMLAMTWLSGGNPPLFMDFRKVWEPAEALALAKRLEVQFTGEELWAKRGFVDGDNSGSASLDWAGKPGAKPERLLKGVSMPQADAGYFPGGGNSVTFVTPGGIAGIAGRLAFSQVSGMFSLVWDQAVTAELPAPLAQAVAATSTPDWPHTWVVPVHATMGEYKQYAPANHFHMTWDLAPSRLEHWMDLTNVLSVTPWRDRPAYIEGVDRPAPLVHLLNGGETIAKMKLAGAM